MAAISKAKDMRIGTVGSVLFEAMELVVVQGTIHSVPFYSHPQINMEQILMIIIKSLPY